MSIFYDNTSGLITLQTKHTSYQMKVDPYRHLQHLYYGAFIGTQDMSYLHRHYDRGFSGNPYVARDDRTYSLDTISQEYLSRLTSFLDYVFAEYEKKGRTHIIIGIGCTGGRHRSVTIEIGRAHD